MNVLDHPILFFFFSLFLLMAAVILGDRLRLRFPLKEDVEWDDFDVVRTAMLTLLALLVGFTFSMAVSRYDMRKNYEEVEANAIGTEFTRASLLPQPDAEKTRRLLKQYLDLRVLFYYKPAAERQEITSAETTRLQNELWATVQAHGVAQPNPLMTLVVSGMNDVFNAQCSAQAAFWNRIPAAAWILLIAIAFGCNLAVGFGVHRKRLSVLLTLPLAISLAFFLIADIDCPHRGVIRVVPKNLRALEESWYLHPPA